MKNLAIVFSFVVALFSDAGAMQSEVLGNASEKLNIVRYEVKGNSQFEAIQAPSESKIRVRGIFGPGVMIAQNININGIKLQYNTNPNELKRYLSIFWKVNANSILHREESISRETFSSLF